MRGAVRASVAAAFVAAALCGTAQSTSPAASTDPAQDIRDIRGPKFVRPDWLLPLVLAGGLLLGFGAYGAWRWRRRRRQRPISLSPMELALQRLEELRALMLPASAAAFSVAVSDIVRSYIEQRFAVVATRRTTEEFLHDLLESSHASLARHRALLGKFLHLCDFVKFGGLSLTPQNMESLRQSARTFVLATAQLEKANEIGETRDSLPST
ncbi:MAG TPA: hypothetical protein VKH13_04430 [Steroidobacteraceae bacterium]|nr:hypothetical protein [Steroidobacteraceae bacterium]